MGSLCRHEGDGAQAEPEQIFAGNARTLLKLPKRDKLRVTALG